MAGMEATQEPGVTGFYYGPVMCRIDCCTITTNKFIRYFGGGASYGGGFKGVGVWNDTTTPWTSLGTIIVGMRAASTSPPATMSGAVIVRRLA